MAADSISPFGDHDGAADRSAQSRCARRGAERKGFVCIENAIDRAWIERAQAYVHSLVEQKDKRYFALNWLSRDQGTPPQELTDDPQMRGLIENLAQIGCPRAKLDEEIYTGLRVVAGSTGVERSLLYHYDKHVITALRRS